MSNKKISIDGFSNAINEILEKYGDEAAEVMKNDLKDVCKEARKKVSANSPKRTGAYAKSWKVKVDETRLDIKGTIFNEKYRLVHLLEKGHALRNGGRAKAFPHVAPVNEWGQEEFTKRIEEDLQK